MLTRNLLTNFLSMDQTEAKITPMPPAAPRQQIFAESLRMLDMAQQTLILNRSKEVSDTEATELLSYSQEITHNVRSIIG